MFISIHAPARGATNAVDTIDFGEYISIHAPARGATILKGKKGVHEKYFNPRTREGCDLCIAKRRFPSTIFQSTHPRGVRQKYRKIYRIYKPISIHAPARGATRSERRVRRRRYHFNPRTREGCDERYKHRELGFQDFNPRTREGCDYLIIRRKITQFIFQSTHPRGVRQSGEIAVVSLGDISIHAPARGATGGITTLVSWFSLFQSTHPRGVRLYRGSLCADPERISIHAPARGATCRVPVAHPRFVISIHAPARGATERRGAPGPHRNISIHAPARGATVFLSPSRAFFHTAKSFLSVLSLFCMLFCETVSALFCSARPLKASVNPIPGCSSRPVPWFRSGAPNFFPDCRFVWNLSLDRLYHVIWI